MVELSWTPLKLRRWVSESYPGRKNLPPDVTEAMQSRHAFNRFDFLRFLLATLVIFSHSFVLLEGPGKAEPLTTWTRGQTTLGSVAVNFFFVASGFLITASWIRTNTLRSYLSKRILRIYPAFLLALLLQTLVILPLVSAFHGFSLRDLLLLGFNALDLVGYGYPYGAPQFPFPHNPFPGAMNGSMWTIRFEVMCYLLVPLLAGIGLLRRPGLLLLVWTAIVLLAASGAQLPTYRFVTALVGTPRIWPRFLSFFLAGMLLYLYRERVKIRADVALIALLCLVLAARVPPCLTLLMPVCGAYILIWLAMAPSALLTEFGRYGDFSYGMYLWAFPIQQLIISRLGPHLTPLRLFAMALPLSVAAGIASWFAVEKWCLKLKRRTAAPNLRAAGVVPATALP